MKFKVDSSNSPTFNYFVMKINHENGYREQDLSDAYKAACDYIEKAYPDAKPGSNYWSRKCNENNSLPDQYFLRRLTFRGCIPPYKDTSLEEFEKEVKSFVCANTKTEPTEEAQDTYSYFGV